MNNQRLFMLASIMLVLFLTGSGCGGISIPFLPGNSVEQETNDEQVADEETGDVEPLSSQEALTRDWINFRAFVKLVQRAAWEHGDGAMLTQYRHTGNELINGVPTDKVEVSIEETEPEQTTAIIFWVNDEGRIVRAVQDGAVLESNQYGLIIGLSVPPLLPFALEEHDPGFNQEFKRALAGQPVPGWEIHSWERERDWLGGKPADIYQVEMRHAPAWDTQLARFSFADFGPFRIILSLDHHTKFTTTDLAFRQ